VNPPLQVRIFCDDTFIQEGDDPLFPGQTGYYIGMVLCGQPTYSANSSKLRMMGQRNGLALTA